MGVSVEEFMSGLYGRKCRRINITFTVLYNRYSVGVHLMRVDVYISVAISISPNIFLLISNVIKNICKLVTYHPATW
jgi:hypothetical protein